ncbi:hypothetical protein AOXY_G13993 [Acipenser oxyrinchus oxyrinchus]|uniref:Uncharacterized protein n=1 Tax=Acipenser oxyrinchus oxyrinchus TaxID=40147 RepID=A0AAD8G669_ACIOX|nr:hypothetical protein AOXY_G13993 [Acipenser oxyrinchus oxyrinchus]
MSVVLRNLQRAVPLRRARLRKDVETLRHILGIYRFDLGLICVDNQRIQYINKTYRQNDSPTDVLSFPFYEDLKAGVLPSPLHQDDCNLGDIFLGLEYIYRQCEEQEVDDFHSILTVVTAHGLCHLLGYRHRTEMEWKQMFQKESQVLEEFNRRTGHQLQPLTKNAF